MRIIRKNGRTMTEKVLMQQMKVAFLGRLVNHGGKKERNAVMKEVDNCLCLRIGGGRTVYRLDSMDTSDSQPLINQSNIDQMLALPSEQGLEVVEQFTDCLYSIENSDFQPLINQSNIDQMPSVPSKQGLEVVEQFTDCLDSMVTPSQL